MDEDALRKSMVQHNLSTAPPEEEELNEEEGDFGAIMRNEARQIGRLFTNTNESPERRRLQERYNKIDGWLGELQAIEAKEDATVRAEERGKLRAHVFEEFRKWRGGGAAHRQNLRNIERGRKEVLEKQKAGAGEATQRRIKAEIEYLIENFTPTNEKKIETLIDKWRRSGDSDYDPAIKLRFRKAKKKKSSGDYAI